MAMTVKRKKDSNVLNIFLTKLADVPGGVSIKVSLLVAGILKIGAVIGPKVSGVCSVLKTAVFIAGGTLTAVRIEKGSHFKIGDFICAKIGGKAYAITGISTTNSAYDVLTVGTAIDNPDTNDKFVYQALAEAVATTSVFAVTPYALVGTQAVVEAGDNIITDAWAIATVKSGNVGASVLSALKGIVEL